MTARLDAALVELAAAIREEVVQAAAARSDAPPELLSVQAAADRLGIGRSRLYAEIGAGRLCSIRVGRRRLIATSALADFLHLNMKEAGTATNGTGLEDGGYDTHPRRRESY